MFMQDGKIMKTIPELKERLEFSPNGRGVQVVSFRGSRWQFACVAPGSNVYDLLDEIDAQEFSIVN